MVELRGRISSDEGCGELEHSGRPSSCQSGSDSSSDCRGRRLPDDDSQTAELEAEALRHTDRDRARETGCPSGSPEWLVVRSRAVADMLWLRGLGCDGEEPPLVAVPLEWPLLTEVCRRWMTHRSLLLLREPVRRTIFEALPLGISSSISRVQLTESFRSIMPFITGEVGEDVVPENSRLLRPREQRLCVVFSRLESCELMDSSCSLASAAWSCTERCLRWYWSSSLANVSFECFILSYLTALSSSPIFCWISLGEEKRMVG